VHGTSADHTRWAPVVPALEQHFTVYACDRRGRGASGDAADYAMEREFEDVAAIVDGIGGPVDLMGHSYGAICSLEASLLTSNVRRLALYEPPIPAGAPIYPPSMHDRLGALLAKGDREGVVATFWAEVVRAPPEQLALLRSLPAWQGRVAAAHTIVRELLAHDGYVFQPEKFTAMTTPTLLLVGGSSPPFFRAAIDRVSSALPQAYLVVMPDQQHAAMDTGTAAFVDLVLAFLRA
jgi:pimeloyl-ACP methyl ester carboxylesterase